MDTQEMRLAAFCLETAQREVSIAPVSSSLLLLL
jgi:hypothetical protein